MREANSVYVFRAIVVRERARGEPVEAGSSRASATPVRDFVASGTDALATVPSADRASGDDTSGALRIQLPAIGLSRPGSFVATGRTT